MEEPVTGSMRIDMLLRGIGRYAQRGFHLEKPL
jgi:hypothetical protein